MNRFVPLALIAAFLFTATAALAADPVTSCQSKKLKAWAKLRSCEHKASAKEVTGGTVDPAACKTKFDADLAKAGTACRYLDNGDGTVTDLDSGLMWQKTDDDGGVTDKDNAYTWGRADTGSISPDGTAFTVFLGDYFSGLNNCVSVDGTTISGGFAGHCDWRLPRIDELKTILLQPDPCAANPCIDQDAFGPTNAESVYWSATSSGNPNWANFVILGSTLGGRVSSNYKFSTYQVRAVRNGL